MDWVLILFFISQSGEFSPIQYISGFATAAQCHGAELELSIDLRLDGHIDGSKRPKLMTSCVERGGLRHQ